jgi:hypothetical protein
MSVVVTLVLAGAGSAGATMQTMTGYKKAYPEAKAVSCKICHEAAMGTANNLNAYGNALTAFKGEGKAKALTAEDFKAFEADDLDKDGVANQKEIEAGTDVNDPTSVPAASTSTP